MRRRKRILVLSAWTLSHYHRVVNVRACHAPMASILIVCLTGVPHVRGRGGLGGAPCADKHDVGGVVLARGVC